MGCERPAGLKRSNSELQNMVFRRSLYFVEVLKKAKLLKLHIRRIRPGYGLSPKYFEDIVGKRVLVDVERGQPVLERQNRFFDLMIKVVLKNT